VPAAAQRGRCMTGPQLDVPDLIFHLVSGDMIEEEQ
jgi:hypothetical protein